MTRGNIAIKLKHSEKTQDHQLSINYPAKNQEQWINCN